MKRPTLKRPGPQATVNWLWAAGVAGMSLGVALERGLGLGLVTAGVLLLATASLFAKGSA
ncbi:MAG: hypothetical protein ACREKH_14715 [Candidatus Rokuibacteriota bacterium]